jgi:tRNA-specific 2-thiouridylase
VALSGGVDSSVAALMMKQAGRDVVGVYVNSWDAQEEGGPCTSEEEWALVQRIGEQLEIPTVRVETVKEYWNRVFTPALEEWSAGLTPNPDVACNVHIKFDALARVAFDRLGASVLVTGHYARLQKTEEGRALLLRGVHRAKDQSYFLCQLKEAALARTEFPMGELTKERVRELAREAGLPNAARASSQGLCFVGPRPFDDFLSQYLPRRPGPILDLAGQPLGEHKGVHLYTIGERLGLSGRPARYYACGKDVEKNTLYACDGYSHPALYTEEFFVHRFEWINGRPPAEHIRGEYKVRHSAETYAGELERVGEDLWRLRSVLPHRAITPGQIAAFYQGEVCLGGGPIRSRGPTFHELGRPVPLNRNARID